MREEMRLWIAVLGRDGDCESLALSGALETLVALGREGVRRCRTVMVF